MSARRAEPWVILHHGRFFGTRRSRRAAMNAVDRGARRVFGNVRIYHRKSGEEWLRRVGSWFKSDAAAAEVARAPRAAGDEAEPAENSAAAVSVEWTPWWIG